MIVESYQPGMPCWADVSCPDIDKAVQFYGSLFGWVAPEGKGPRGNYLRVVVHPAARMLEGRRI